MDVLTAAANVVEDYPGGAAALAPQIGKAGSTLAHEIDRNYATAKLGLHDAVKISKRTGDNRILQAFAAECSHYVLPIPEIGERGDVTERVVTYTQEVGQYLSAVAESIRDNLVTDNELAKCERELGEMIGAASSLMRLVKEANARTRARVSTLERVA